MKKHLLAAAVATAIAAPAMAQNVTITGDIHVGYEAFDNGTDPSVGRSISKSGLMGNSNISILATEDLGGGMKVTVNFTGDLDPDTTSVTLTSSTIADSDFFSDERSLTLSGNFGALTLGLSDVSGAQGIDGKVSKAGDFGNTLKVAGQATELGADKQGVVRYTLPKMGAVTLQVGIGQTNAAQTTDQNNSITSVYGEAALGLVDVYFGYEKLDAASSEAQRDNVGIGLAGNVGPVAVGLKYGSGDTATSGAKNRQKDVLLSASYGLGNGFTLHGAVGNVKNSTSASKGEMTALAVTKALSKRTTVYLSHQEAEAGTGANMETGGALAVAAGKSGSVTGIGIHHKF